MGLPPMILVDTGRSAPRKAWGRTSIDAGQRVKGPVVAASIALGPFVIFSFFGFIFLVLVCS